MDRKEAQHLAPVTNKNSEEICMIAFFPLRVCLFKNLSTTIACVAYSTLSGTLCIYEYMDQLVVHIYCLHEETKSNMGGQNGLVFVTLTYKNTT